MKIIKFRQSVCAATIAFVFFFAAFAHADLVIDTTSLPNATEMVAYNQTLTASGGTAPYTWTAARQAMTRRANTWSEVSSLGTSLGTDPSFGGIDDGAWSVQLPFAFPFYGETYTNIWVTSNGNIFFSNDLSTDPRMEREYNREEGRLKQAKMLAVGWCDSATDSDHLIYALTAADRAVIRFDLDNSCGNIIKAAAELKADGSIILRYSTDDSANVNSYCAVGVSAGNGSDYIYQDYSSGQLHGTAVEDIVFTVSSYTLPEGVTLSSGGVLSGTAAVAGDYGFIAKATDNAAAEATKYFSLVIEENPNRPPVIEAQTPAATGASVAHSESIDFTVTATDPESSALTYSWKVNGVEKFTAGANWTWTTDFYDGGNFTVTCDVSDGLWTRTATWNVYVSRGLTWYVNGTTGNDSNTGYDAGHPFQTIKTALSWAIDGETILVAEGTYKEGYDTIGVYKYPNLTITDGRHLTLRATGARDATVIDAEGQSSCLWLNTKQGVNTNVVVEGFTLKNGQGSFLTGVNNLGGGTFGGWLKNCRIVDCASADGGGASYAKLEDCVVENCSATSEGGGLHRCETDRTIIRNCSLTGTGTGRGAGVYRSTCRNCLIVGNTIADTKANGYGAGAYDGELYNCTIANNQTLASDNGDGAGLYANDSGTILANSIVYGNTHNGEVKELYQGNVWNSLTNNPSFVNAAGGDYTLSANSAAIDAGSYRYATVGTDLAGNTRLQGEAIDLGCYERAPVLSFDASAMTIPGGAAVTEPVGRIAVSGGTAPYTYTYGTTGVDARGGLTTSANSFALVGARDATLSSSSDYYNLPFDFPFGGESFSRVYVNSYGGLSFCPNETWSEQFGGYSHRWDDVTNNAYRAVIPFNSGLTIDADDPTMGVFVESSSDAITFRWSGRCSTYGRVGFSCTLRKSGEIVFAYGDYPTEVMTWNHCAGIAWADRAGIDLTDEIPDDSAVGRTFTFRPTVMPPASELTLNADGIITGTPTHYGEYFVKVTVTDAASYTASAWMPIQVTTTYSVSFAANGGAGDPMTGWTDIAYGAVQTAPACTYTLAGSTFLGWTTNALGGSTVYQPGDSISALTDVANGSVTLHALWKLNLLTDHLTPATGGTAYHETLSAVGGTSPREWSWGLVTSNYNPVARAENSFAEVGTAQAWYADDQCWRYELPFAFKFYGTHYTNVWVNSNGTLSFGDDNFAGYSYSESTLKQHAMIAVAWADLTPRAEQPIKIAADASSVTFCWMVSDRQSGTVNASCTLFKNGAMTLKYGPSAFRDAAVGISAGDGVRAWYQEFDSGELAGVEDFVFTYPGVDAFQLDPATGVITDVAGDGSELVGGDYPVAVTVTSADSQSVTSNYVLSVTTSYKVRFNKRDGAGEMDDQVCAWGTDEMLSSNEFTLAGSTFQGWATNANGEVVYADGDTVRDLEPHQGGIVNLYAVWSVQIPEQTLPPAMGGVDYAGALTTKGASEPVTWTLDGESTMPPGLKLNANGTITGRPTEGGVFTFDAKATDALGSTAVRTLTITNKTTYTAHFYPYESGATGSMDNESFVWGEPKALTACGFTYPTYDFVGWATNYYEGAVFTNGETVVNLTDAQGGDVSLWARWHPGYYTLTFDVNAHGVGPTVEPTEAMSNRTVVVGSSVRMPSSSDMPTRLGYYFAGWSTTPNGSVNYYGGSSYALDQARDTTLTLYAVWNQTDHYRTVTVDGNDWTVRCKGEDTRIDTMPITNGATTVTIPATVLEGRPVTQYGNRLLADATNVTELVFSSGLTGFASGSYQSAFASMVSLERVTFPNGFTNIIQYAFNNCQKLREVEFGEGLVEIEYGAFGGCVALVSVSLPTSVNKVGGYAFNNTKKIAFAGDVETVEQYAFYSASRLRFAGAAPTWSIADACVSSYLRHIQHGADSSWNTFEPPTWTDLRVYPLGSPVAGVDGNTWYGRDDGATAALVDPALASGAVTLPDTFGGKPVTVLATGFMAGNGNVSSVVIPATVTNIENYAFYRCPVLTEIFLTSTNLTVYGDQEVYKNSPIAHVYYLPQHATKWAGKAMFGVTTEPWPETCMWTAHFDANAVDAEGAMADQLQPAGYEVPLTANAFRRPNKKFVSWETDEEPSVNYDNGATPSAHSAGAEVTFRAVWQDATLYTVKFDVNGGKPGSQPAMVDLEVGVAESTVVLPALTEDDRDNYWRFLGWATNSTAKVADYEGGTVYRDASAVQHQTNTLYAVWQERQEWTDRYEPAEVGVYDVNGCKYRYHYYGDGAILLEAKFSGSPTRLEPPAMLGGLPLTYWNLKLADETDYASIRSVIIPRTVKTIREYAFNECANVTNIVFEAPSELKALPYGFCQYATGLESIVLPGELQSIGGGAFQYCHSLTEIVLPDSVTFLGNSAFYNCSNLVSVVLPRNLTRLTESSVFSGCPIERLELPACFENAAYYSLSKTQGFRFLGNRPTWDVNNANRGAATLFEFPATNTTWNAGKINNYKNATYKGFVGPIATMGATKCYFWTNANETVTFAYAEDALGAEVEVPAQISWGGVTWTVTGLETNAFAGQPTTSIRYPASWTEQMWSVDPATLAEGLTNARPIGAYCTVTFNGGTGSSGTMADFYVPTDYVTHLPSNTLTKTGYIFKKWQKLSAPTADYADGAAFTGAADGTVVVLNADWDYVGNYTIHFDGNSAQAVGVPVDMLPPVGTTPAIPSPAPTREGWEFGGWTNVANSTIYQPGDVFNEGCAKDQTFTLYAKWTETASTITGLTYTDGDGTTWTYNRKGDDVWVTNVVPSPSVETLVLPESINGSTTVVLQSGYNLPEKVNGLWWYFTINSNQARITGYSGTLPTSLVIPSQLGGKNVVGFQGQSQFCGLSALVSVEFPATITEINRYHFENCPNLETVIFHEGLTYISDSFRSDPKLKEIAFPSSLANWNNSYSFSSSGTADRGYDVKGFRYADTDHRFIIDRDTSVVGEVVIPDGVVDSMSSVFTHDSKMTSCVLPEGFKLYGGMFNGSTLTSVSMPGSILRRSDSNTAETTTITNVLVRGVSPSWDLKSYFTGLTTIHYDAKYETDWAAYKSTYSTLTYVDDLVPYATIAFDKGQGTGVMSDMMFVECAVPTNLPSCTFEREGYMFAGWALQPDGDVVCSDGGVIYIPVANRDTEVRLYAKWTAETYTITYELNGGENAAANPTNYTVASEEIVLADPTRDGYSFAGWDPEGVIPSGSLGDKVFTACWAAVLFNDIVGGDIPSTGATYNGFLGAETLKGSFTLVVSKYKDGAATAKTTITVTDASTGAKTKVVGEVNLADGKGTGELDGLIIGANGVAGTFKGEAATGAPDAAKAKDTATLEIMNAFDKSVYGLAFVDYDGNGGTVNLTFSKKGKVKVTGSYRGYKVSATAQMSVGDVLCAVPVQWVKKNGPTLSFVAWFDKTSREFVSIDHFEAAKQVDAFGKSDAPAAGTPFTFNMMSSEVLASVPAAIAQTPYAVDTMFDGKKFDAGKAAKVTYKDGVVSVDTSKGDNISGLVLKYSKGALSGSFTVYSIDSDKDKLVKNKFKASGVIVDGVGYGISTAKGLKELSFFLSHE